MNAERAYRKHVEEGPDSLSLEDTLAALEWRDSHPAEALRIRSRHEAEQREEQERQNLAALWAMDGNDPKEFGKHYSKLREEHQESKLRELDRGARDDSLRRMMRSF